MHGAGEMAHQLRACAEDQSAVPSTQRGGGQLTVAYGCGSGALDCFGDTRIGVNMSAGLGSVKHGDTSLLTGRALGSVLSTTEDIALFLLVFKVQNASLTS